MGGSEDTTTESARVPDKYVEPTGAMLDAGNRTRSDLIKAAFQLYAEDEIARDFFNQYIDGDVDSLQEYAVNQCVEEYDIKPTEDLDEKLYFGLTSIISGVQNQDKTQAEKGCEELAILDENLAIDVAEYLDGLGGNSNYWNS